MVSTVGFLALIGGVAVLVGNFLPDLVEYPLVLIGAGISILAGVIDHFGKRRKIKI